MSGTWAPVKHHSGQIVRQRQGTQLNKTYHPLGFIFFLLRKNEGHRIDALSKYNILGFYNLNYREKK